LSHCFFSFSKLNTNTPATNEFGDLIKSWNKAPITEFNLSSTSTCPTGFTLLDHPIWPGKDTTK